MDFQDLKNSEVKQYLLANADWVCEVCGDYNSDCCAKHIEWKKGRCDVCFNEASVTSVHNFDCLKKGILAAYKQYCKCCAIWEIEQEEKERKNRERLEWEKPDYCDIVKYKEIQKENFKREYCKKHGIIN